MTENGDYGPRESPCNISTPMRKPVMNVRRCYRTRCELRYVWAVRIAVLCLLAAGICFGESQALAGPDLAEQYTQRGNEKYINGDYSGAIADFTEVIKINPENAMAYISRALARSRSGNINGAIGDYNAVIKIDPNSRIAYNNRGLLKLNAGDNDNAITDFTKALAIDARSFFAYYNRANARFAKSDYEGAIADLTAAIKIKRRPAQPYYWRALAKIKTGDNEGAVADFTEAIRGNASYAPAYNSRGLAKFDTGDYDGAIGDYNRAIRVEPNYVAAYNNRGIAKHKKRRYDDAIADFDEAIRMNPQHANAHANRANVKKDKADYSGALADFTKAIKLQPKDALSYRRRGHLHYDAGRWFDSLKDLGMATQLQDDVKHDNYDLLRIWLIGSRLGERDKATALLEAHLKNHSSAKMSDWYKAICLFLLGRSSEETLIRAADDPDFKKANEQSCEAYFFAGSVRIIDGDRSQALPLLRQCIATNLTHFTEHASAKAEVESILIGAHFEPVAQEARRSVVLDTGVGLSLRNVGRGGPADRAGLKEKDILTTINGRPATFEAVRQLCESGKPNQTVKLAILRLRRPMDLILTLDGPK